MNILAVYAHPNPKSFNRALLEALLDEAAAKGHECEVRDLYGISFQPALAKADFEAFSHGKVPKDIKTEQDAVRRTHILVFLHPIWWLGPPAILKGWIDRVFSYGFAYGHDSRGVTPLLADKKAIVVNTAGAPEEPGYAGTGYRDAMRALIDDGIYRFVGLDVVLHRVFYEVPSASDEERRGMLETLRMDLRRIL